MQSFSWAPKALLIVLICFSSGCEMAQESQETVAEGAKRTVQQIDRSKALSDLTLLTAALQSYHLQHGKYPAKLQDLDLKAVHHPEDLDYDPETGTLRSKSYPEL
ncbi:MAG: hypothetical protein IGS03_12965 [Candidatus Sericytochromatia bacterium]|nr:hypothetical protein [Candidatus Sericytochromatia bacterium]